MVNFEFRPIWQRSLLRMAGTLGLRSGNGNCLALYANSDGPYDLEGCFEIFWQECSALGIQPDLIGYGDGDQMVSFDQGLEKLQKSEWADIGTISLKATRGHGDFLTGWLVSVVASPKYGYLVFCFSDDLGGFDEHGFISLAQRLWAEFEFNYGIAYQHPLQKGADIYAVGMAAGLGYSHRDKAERQSIGKWFQANIYFRENADSYSNYLRDVYKLNFLSPVHLNQMVDGMRLEDWIAKSPSRGTIEPLVADRIVWKVRDGDIRVVREILKKNSLLVAYRADVPPFG